jgi:protein-tyrosine phosphatase
MDIIDIHCHILPGIDDGSPDLEETVGMLYLAAASGVKKIVATPHSYVDKGDFLSFREKIDDAYSSVCGVIKHEKIPVELLLGMELLITSDLEDRLYSKSYITMNETKNILIEFTFEESFEYMDSAIKTILAEGLTPVIAHPERYVEIQGNPERVRSWLEKGCMLQLNKGSFIGYFGEESKKSAVYLLKKGFAQFIASDAHSSKSRTTYLRNIEDFLNNYFGEEYSEILLKRNSEALLYGGKPEFVPSKNNG